MVVTPPMVVTLLPISTLVRPEQESKAESSIVITLLGMVMLARPQEANARYPMVVTQAGNRDGHRVQAIEEVLAEGASGNELGKVHRRRRNEPGRRGRM